MSKKKKELQGMILFSCEKWDKKCNSVQPCQMVVPMHCKKITGCPEDRYNTKWKRVPTARLTI